jgi:hypothetical protein
VGTSRPCSFSICHLPRILPTSLYAITFNLVEGLRDEWYDIYILNGGQERISLVLKNPKDLLLSKIISKKNPINGGCIMSETEMCREIPRMVVISDAAVPSVARGGRVFSGQVINSDPEIKNGEIVRVVDRKEHILSMAQVFNEP